MELRERWELIQKYTHHVDIAVVAVLIAAVAWWIFRRLHAR
jgi:hypothetical protein